MQPSHEFALQIGHAVQEIHPVELNPYSNETNQSFSSNHSYEVLPPGVDREPPPPGFENEVLLKTPAFLLIKFVAYLQRFQIKEKNISA